MSQDIRICFVGDSLVNGTGDETALGWTGRLCAAVAAGGTPVTYYNLGIRADTSADVLLRWQRECALRLPPACDARIVLSCGVNDTTMADGRLRVSPDDSVANVREILGGDRRYKWFMVGPPPVADSEQNERIKRTSDAFARVAATLAVPFVETFSALASDPDYIGDVRDNDGAHPRSRGYGKIARLVASAPAWWFR